MSLSVSLIQSPNNSRKSAINLVDKGLYATMNRWRIDPWLYGDIRNLPLRFQQFNLFCQREEAERRLNQAARPEPTATGA